MLKKMLEALTDRVIRELPYFGSINIKLFFHQGRFVKYEFDKSETTVIPEQAQK
jgi:hypothetical protein